ncbi:hypothetical protein BKE38_12685 [Pseudoroseomonas deserti]|uniref:Uncharacterized protein n=1 Tax=Teichococcus deserti TaxID=1817963 RepID=A0A1V2H2L9_9PROT|nr:hypothetical protein BKE38_12685 [Pseudoroseomonas deserti]
MRSRCSHLGRPPHRTIAVADIADSRGDVTLGCMAEGTRYSACGATASVVGLVLRSTVGDIIQPVRGHAQL